MTNQRMTHLHLMFRILSLRNRLLNFYSSPSTFCSWNESLCLRLSLFHSYFTCNGLVCWYKVHRVFSLSLWLPFYYFFFFLRGSARKQSHEYKTYTANGEVSGPGGEETALLFHFKPVSLTDDFWAPHHFCHLPSPHFTPPFSLYLWFEV